VSSISLLLSWSFWFVCFDATFLRQRNHLYCFCIQIKLFPPLYLPSTCFLSIFDVPSFIHIAGLFAVGVFVQSRELCYILRRTLRGRVVGLTPHAQTRSVTSHRNLFSTLVTFHTLYVVCGGPTCRVFVTREPSDVHLKGILSRTDKLTFLLHEVIIS